MQQGHVPVVRRVGGASGGGWRIVDRDLDRGKGLPLLTSDELVDGDGPADPDPAASAP